MLEPDREIWQCIYKKSKTLFFFSILGKKNQIANLRQEKGWTVQDESC
jgi:hypothetical protein